MDSDVGLLLDMDFNDTSPSHPFTVSEITQAIKAVLERGFRSVRVEGEVSNLRPASSGHVYFSIKDDEASMSAVLFRNRRTALESDLRDGDQVILSGSLSVYPPRGSYQLIVEHVERSGEGQILRMLEERKRRLEAEGLFDPAHRQPLPVFPRRVAVVTSPTGAAVKDVLQVMRRRAAGVDVCIVPTAVQGDAAAAGIVRAIEQANRHRLGDVIIVTRGGGSIEDLLPFSDEAVVRAVAASAIPVISAVGHEIDVALCDYAADSRAPTPSAAAELVCASREELAGTVLNLGRSLVRSFLDRRDRARLAIRRFSARELERSLRYILQPRQQRLDEALQNLSYRMTERVHNAGYRIRVSKATIESADPAHILKRGYAIVRDAHESILSSADMAGSAPSLSIDFHDGRIGPFQNNAGDES
ncbi:MAG: exodeoxyribonuclease VII large subunit [Spirochaetaceae bacterium]